MGKIEIQNTIMISDVTNMRQNKQKEYNEKRYFTVRKGKNYIH